MDDNVILSTPTKIVGVTYGKRQIHIMNTSEDSDIYFVHETNNEYDPNAIAVYNEKNQLLGYLSASLASEIADLMSKYPNAVLEGYVLDITGGGDYNYGCNIQVELLKEGRGHYPSTIDGYSIIELRYKIHSLRKGSTALNVVGIIAVILGFVTWDGLFLTSILIWGVSLVCFVMAWYYRRLALAVERNIEKEKK